MSSRPCACSDERARVWVDGVFLLVLSTISSKQWVVCGCVLISAHVQPARARLGCWVRAPGTAVLELVLQYERRVNL